MLPKGLTQGDRLFHRKERLIFLGSIVSHDRGDDSREDKDRKSVL